MKRLRTGVLLSIVVGCGVSLAAQAGTAAQGGQARPQSNETTVTGCLQRSAASGATGTAGTAGAAAMTPFILTSAMPSGSAGASTPSAAGTTGSTYGLDGVSTELTPHVGHKVEITGTLERVPAAPGSPTSAPAQKLKVSSVKMISANCSASR